jgi:hypothetical protein
MAKKINLKELAKKVAKAYNMPTAEDYNMVLREFDWTVEIIGLVNDPNVSREYVISEGIKYPKSWVTLGTIPANNQVRFYK